MNMNNNILLTLILILILIIIFLQLYKNHNEFFDNSVIDKSVIDKLSYCTDNTNIIEFNNIHTNNITIEQKEGKELQEYFLNICYPIGSFYVQFPDISNNLVETAFPILNTPEKLFGGGWTLMWEKDTLFFRTQGTLANDKRDQKGIQNDAMINLTGYTSWTQTDYNKRYINTATEVFKNSNSFIKIGTDKGTSSDEGLRNYFDLSTVANVGTEVRVRNRIIRIWKRLK